MVKGEYVVAQHAICGAVHCTLSNCCALLHCTTRMYPLLKGKELFSLTLSSRSLFLSRALSLSLSRSLSLPLAPSRSLSLPLNVRHVFVLAMALYMYASKRC